MNANWQMVLGGVALAAAMATSTPAHADGVGMWDVDKSGTLDYNEWNTGWGKATTWDLDGDGVLTDREYSEGIFDMYDVDDDKHWNADEMKKFEDEAGERGWLDS